MYLIVQKKRIVGFLRPTINVRKYVTIQGVAKTLSYFKKYEEFVNNYKRQKKRFNGKSFNAQGGVFIIGFDTTLEPFLIFYNIFLRD